MNRTARPASLLRRSLASLMAVAATVATVTATHAGMLAPGAEFPSFSLKNEDAATVTSADLAGKTVLLWFYPKAKTPGCTVEARGLRDQYAALEAAGVTVLGVSFDAPEANKAFVQAESLPFHLLSDTERKLAMSTGSADSASAMFARRISYLVGPDGKIRKAWDDVDPSTHAAEVLAAATETPGAK